MEATRSARKTRFGAFEVDLRSGEVRKHGIRLKIQDQPFQVLVHLLEHPGEIVTREELHQKLWPADTFVDFDTGLNSAIKKLRDALGDSAEEPRYIETVPRRGYRFIAPLVETPPIAVAVSPAVLEVSAEDKAASPPSSELPVPTTKKRFSPARLNALFRAVGVLALATFALVLYRVSVGKRASQPSIRSLAVLPLKNLSGDPAQEYLADGITEELIGKLAAIHDLRVISRTSVMRLKTTQLSMPEIAKTLGVDAVVEGSVIRESNRIRVHAQLIRGATDEHLWAESFDRDMQDLLALESDVAQAIARKVEVTVTLQEHTRLAAARHVSAAASEAYLKGRYYWNKRSAEGLQTALNYFQEAIHQDPAYCEAYSGLADCNSGLTWHGFHSPAEVLPKAHAAAVKAIEIDPESAEAHASLALVLHHQMDWSAAEAEFRRALQLDPRYANAHHWYGDYLSVTGRHEEALREAQRALELDPLNLMIGTWVGLRYYLARNYDRAIEQGQRTVALDPNFAASHLLLGESYVQVGRHEQGLTELQRAASLSGNSPLYVAQVGVAYAAAGRKSEALRVVEQLQTLSRKQYVSPYGLAQIYAALNDREETFKYLQSAYDGHAVWMTYLAVDPIFDRFRSDVRFQELLRRLALLPPVVATQDHPSSTPEDATAVSYEVSQTLVGRQITIRGKFASRVKADPYVVLDNQQEVWIGPRESSLEGSYSRMDGKLVEASGTLRFYHDPAPVDETRQREPDHFYFEAGSAQVRLVSR